MDDRSTREEEKRIEHEDREIVHQYLHGKEPVEVESGEVDGRDSPGTSKMSMMARAGGAAAGAALAGAAVAAAGLPLVTLGAGAAVMGAVAGSVAGEAVTKEWVRGEILDEAMEFDQPEQQAAAREAGNHPALHKDKHASTIFAIGEHYHHASPEPGAADKANV